MAEWCEKQPVPPKDACGQLRLSSLCERGWQPLLVTGLLRDMLIRHFSDPRGIAESELRQYIWHPDEQTGILIESVQRWRGDVVQKRPAILLKRNAYQQVPIVLNDLTDQDEEHCEYEDYNVLWVGSHTLFCLHGSGAAADILATEVISRLVEFSPIVRRYLNLDKFAVTEVGPISEIEEAKESYTVPVTVGWSYQGTWRIRHESLPLQKISMSVLLGMQPLDRPTGQ